MRTHLVVLAVLAVAGVAGLTGCGMRNAAPAGPESPAGGKAVVAGREAPLPEGALRVGDRMLVWRARMGIEVRDVRASMDKAVGVAEGLKGYVEERSVKAEKSGSLRLRVPSASLQDAVAQLEALGRVTHRHVNADDVTEQYVDMDARLKNRVELRDRLRRLLDKAADVKDVIAIETELNRVQSDIDAMEARLRMLRGRADYATIDVSLTRPPILGPLGYAFKGLGWAIAKLFVIRG